MRVVPENQEEKTKRRLIEEALKDPETPIETWREFARSEYGLINGELHHMNPFYATKESNYQLRLHSHR